MAAAREWRELQRSAQRKKWGGKGGSREWAFVGVDVTALWGMCLQGAKGALSDGTGANAAQDLLLQRGGGGWGKNRALD